MDLGERFHLELSGDLFNLFSRNNERLVITDNGFQSTAGQVIKYTQNVGGTYYPAYYQQPIASLQPGSSFAPRQMQLSLRLHF
jgi:hypothetical protein